MFAKADAEVLKMVHRNVVCPDHGFEPIQRQVREDILARLRGKTRKQEKEKTAQMSQNTQAPKQLSRSAFRRWRQRQKKKALTEDQGQE